MVFSPFRPKSAALFLGISTLGIYTLCRPVSISSTSALKSDSKKDDCEIPACNSTKEMLKLAKLHRKDEKKNNNKHHTHNPYQTGCPVMREQLGVSTWNLIHTIAANYPDHPDDVHKENVLKFFHSLSFLYPCPHCAEDFQMSVLTNPPRVSSREELSLWCCELHNDVNKKLGLPTFPCTINELDIRWRIGRDDCWEKTVEE